MARVGLVLSISSTAACQPHWAGYRAGLQGAACPWPQPSHALAQHASPAVLHPSQPAVLALHDASPLLSIAQVHADDMDCWVQAGVTRLQLNRHLHDTGLFFPVSCTW
jgi:hypothetical protein